MATQTGSFSYGRELVRRIRAVDSTKMLEFLSERQYVQPRLELGIALSQASERLGLCPELTARALRWLGMDPAVAIGRVRRTELAQLSRCLQRLKRHRCP